MLTTNKWGKVVQEWRRVEIEVQSGPSGPRIKKVVGEEED